MKVITPLELITSGRLLSSTVVEGSSPDPAVWLPSTAYTLGTRVRVDGIVKKIYENILGFAGSTTSPESDPTHWFEIGYTNKWAMFDSLRSSATQATSSITVSLQPGQRINSVAVFGMTNVTSITLTCFSGAINVYSPAATTGNLKEFVDFNIPAITNIVVNITISGTGTISVGAIVIGQADYLGSLQSGGRVGSTNFSTVTRDSFGSALTVQRGSVPKLSLTLFTKAGTVGKIKSVRDSLNAVPAVWCALDDVSVLPEYFGSTLILGFYTSFSINLASPIHATIALELEEI